MNLKTSLIATVAALVSVVGLSASVPTDPPVFSDPLLITNRFSPFVVGRAKHYEVRQGHTDGEVLDTYLATVRTFAWNGTSVACRTLEERETEDGELHEISLNYFAQADDGTVYYFGEVVDIYEGGVVVSHDGSWLVGGPTAPTDPPETATARDPGLFMPADPEVGDVFKPEDLFPIVDESDEVLRVDQHVSVPAGHFTGCIQIEESSQISAGTETKWYAPGIGVVKVKEHGEGLVLDEVVDP